MQQRNPAFFRVNRCYIWYSFSVVENIKATVVNLHKKHISCIVIMFSIFVSTLGKHFLCKGVIRTLLTWLSKLLHVQPGMRGEKVGYSEFYFFHFHSCSIPVALHSLHLSIGVKRTSRLLASLVRVLSFGWLGGRGGAEPQSRGRNGLILPLYLFQGPLFFFYFYFAGVVFPEVAPTFNIHPLFT